MASRLVRRMMKCGVAVSPDDLAAFKPDRHDLVLARVLQDGNLSRAAIMTALSDLEEIVEPIAEREVKRRLADPVRMAWYNEQICSAMPHRVGQIYLGLLDRALAGQVDAARLFLQRFDKGLRPVTRRETVTANFDLKNMSDDDLQRRLVDSLRGALQVSATKETETDE